MAPRNWLHGEGFDDPVADALGIAGRSDHGHGTRIEERSERGGRGDTLAQLQAGRRALGRVQRELDLHVAAFIAFMDGVSGFPEHFTHGQIVSVCDRPQSGEASVYGQHRQPFEQDRPQAFPVKVVVDCHGDLGLIGGPRPIGTSGDDACLSSDGPHDDDGELLGLVRGIAERSDGVGRRARFQKRTDDVWMPVTTDR